MKIQASPSPGKLSKSSFRWLYRGLVVFVVTFIAIDIETSRISYFDPKSPTLKAHGDVEAFAAALSDYAIEYGSPLEGTPADLLRILRGENDRKIVFLERSPIDVNVAGEFVDPWGQPYHIDQSDPSNPRVYSSGRNGINEHFARGSDDIVSASKRLEDRLRARQISDENSIPWPPKNRP